MDLYDITIVGAGPIGLFGTFYAGMRGMRTKLIDALPEPGGQLAVLYPEKFVYDVPGFPKVLAKDLVRGLIDQAIQFKPTLCMEEQVRTFEYLGGGIIKLETQKQVHFTRTVVVCTGVGAFQPNKLEFPAAAKFEEKGVYYSVRDKNLFRNKRMLIIGGGDSAVDWALNLQHWAKEVTLIHRRDVFRAHESTVASLLASGVRVKLFHELVDIKGDKQIEQAIISNTKTKETTTLPMDVILVFIGYKADLGPLKDWGLQLNNRSVKVNSRTETNLPGVYAAGDIASPSDIPKLNLIVIGFAQVTLAVNLAKSFIDPVSGVFPGHSSEKKF